MTPTPESKKAQELHVKQPDVGFKNFKVDNINMFKEQKESMINYRRYDDHVSSNRECQGFPGGAVVENLPANAGDTGSSPGLGGSHMPQSG